MKNFLKYTYMVALGVMALAFTSCTNDYEYDAPSATGQGGNGYLSVASSTDLFFGDKEDASFVITVHRVNSKEAGTIKLVSNDAEVAPQNEVSFAAGEESKDVTVKVACPANSQKTVTIAVADEDAFLYATNKINYNINVGKQFAAALNSELNEGISNVNVFRFKTQDGDATYKYVVDQPYDKGYYVSFSINFEKNTAVLYKQYAGLYNDDYGRIQMAQTAGSYDPATKTVTFANIKFSLPDSGYSFGTGTEVFTFDVAPDAE